MEFTNLKELNGRFIARTWNASHLKMYYSWNMV